MCRPITSAPRCPLALFDTIDKASDTPLILGFSGGPDSLALACLLRDAQSSGRLPRRPVVAAIVDHGLRDGSDAEAKAACALAEKLGFEARRFGPAENLKAHRNLQTRARHWRREAFFALALEIGADTILLGHTLDDQIETFLMRRDRGSGTDGLAAMRVETPWRHLTLFRPALGLARRTLHRLADVQGLGPIIDPSNADDRFERVRTRKRLSGFSREKRAAIVATIEGYAKRRDRREKQAHDALNRLLQAPAPGVIALERSALCKVNTTLRRLMIQNTVKAVGGHERPIAKKNLERILRQAELNAPFTATLGGALVCSNGKNIHFARENPRKRNAKTKPMILRYLAPGQRLWFDGRLLVEASHRAQDTFIVSRKTTNPKPTAAAAIKDFPPTIDHLARFSGEDLGPLNSLIARNHGVFCTWPQGYRLVASKRT